MNKKDSELFITEISEEDFRKLDLKGYAWSARTSPKWQECSMNKVLDSYIEYALKSGFEHDLKTLQIPITIAIHKENGPEPNDYYLDKYTNILGPATYVASSNIEHLYITRDYFENRAEYWRVRKDETKAIYRIHLDKKWTEKFVLKHKTVISPWPYPYVDELPDEVDRELHVWYDLDEETGEWKVKGYSKVIYYGEARSKIIIPVDENGNELVK